MKHLIPVVESGFAKTVLFELTVKFFIEITEHFFGQLSFEKPKQKALSESGWIDMVFVLIHF